MRHALASLRDGAAALSGWWRVVVPLAAGAVGAALVGALGGGLQAYATLPLWTVILGAGVILAGVGWAYADRARAVARAARAERRRARAERDRLLARLDHELKNPLTAARVALANLRALELPESAALSAAAVEEQLLRIARLAMSLRKLGELSQSVIERAPVQVGELLDELEADLREQPVTGARSLQFAVPRAPWPLPPVSGDRDLLFLALHNLAANALKFSADGDTVEIRAFSARDRVTVEIADSGRGIPAGEQQSVWEELARARNARDVDGSGLGLPLVRAIASLHGGSVSLESREGHGTRVQLELPIDGHPGE